MSAVLLAGAVPDLFEHTGEGVTTMDHFGSICSPLVRVYSAWKRERPGQGAHTYLTLTSGPFALGLHLSPQGARDLAHCLVRAAERAEAHQALVTAEWRAQEE